MTYSINTSIEDELDLVCASTISYITYILPTQYALHAFSSRTLSFLHAAIHGGWSSWVEASPCSVTCGGGGSRVLVRRCNNPIPANGGNDCEGQLFEVDTTCGTCPCEGNVHDDLYVQFI